MTAKMHEYEMVWGGDCDGIYRRSDGRQVASARMDFSESGWYRLIGASADLIDKIGREHDQERKS